MAADLALLTYPKESQGPTVCFVYNSAFNDISRTNNNSSYSAVPIIESFPADGCGNLTSTDRYSGKAILIQRGNCSFAVKASLAQLYGAKLVVIANSDPSAGAFAPGANSSDYESITLPVGMISYQDSQALLLALHSNNNLTIDITTPTANPVDPSFFIMCFSAVVVVILGAFWANNLERTRLNWQIQTLNNGNENENNSTNASRGNNQNNSESSTHRQVADTSLDQNATGQGEQLTLSVKNVLIFLVIAVSIILLMYFLYDYLGMDI